MHNNVNSNIILIWGTYYHKFGQNIKIFKILCTKYMASSEVMTSSTHSFAYSYRLVKKCFVNICETSKCHNFLIFQPIFIRFSLLCLKIFTLSSEIKLNLLWSSSLSLASGFETLGLSCWIGGGGCTCDFGTLSSSKFWNHQQVLWLVPITTSCGWSHL